MRIQETRKLFCEFLSGFTEQRITANFAFHVVLTFSVSNDVNGAWFDVQIDQVKFIYPSAKQIFSSKVIDVIENALMGDDYDALVDAAKVSL